MDEKSSQILGKSYDKIAGTYVTEAYADDPGKPSRDKFIELLPKDGRVLDVGCGGGQDSAGFDAAGLAVVGVDPSERMIELSSALVPSGQFKLGGFLDLELDWDGFDGVWCSRVFQHVPIAEQQEFVKRLHRVLKPDGQLYISVKVNDGQDDDETWNVARGGTKTLVKTLGSESWPAILSANGFEVQQVNDWHTGGWMEAYATKATA